MDHKNNHLNFLLFFCKICTNDRQNRNNSFSDYRHTFLGLDVAKDVDDAKVQHWLFL